MEERRFSTSAFLSKENMFVDTRMCHGCLLKKEAHFTTNLLANKRIN